MLYKLGIYKLTIIYSHTLKKTMLLKLIKKMIKTPEPKVTDRCEDLVDAIRSQKYKLVKILIEGGIDINKAVDGLTPMMEICLSSDDCDNKCRIVLLLLKHGYDMEVRDKYKRTALYYAHLGGSKRVIEILQEERRRLCSK